MKTVIYQTLPRLFGNYNDKLAKNGGIAENGCGKFASYTPKALEQIKDLGVTHVWYTGVIAHATKTDYSAYGMPKDHSAIVKGEAGSPYAIRDYYDVDPDLAIDVDSRMKEFEALVERTHEAGMKVVIDFVPNHVSRSYRSRMKLATVDDLGQRDRTEHAFSHANNFYYIPGRKLELPFGAQEGGPGYSEFPAKATGNDCFSPAPSRNDWYETVKLNYGINYFDGGSKHFSPVPDTWNKMLDILLFWIGKDIDGFRCDMAEMVPVEFWNWAVPRVQSRKKAIFIAEVYNPGQYRDYIRTGHFDYLYDKVGMYDTLRRIIRDEAPAADIAKCRQAINDISGRMLFFTENHDEQRLASDFFAGDPQRGIPALMITATSGTNPVMIYNGQETGERGMDEEGFSGRDGRTSIFDYWSMDSLRRWANNGRFDGGQSSPEEKELREKYKKILRLATSEKAFSDGLFYGLAYCNAENPDFDSRRMTAYLRKSANETILAAVNFGDEERTVRINIPQDAFDALQIQDNAAAQTTDLLTGEKGVSTLTARCPYRMTVPPRYGKMIKFSY